MLMKRTGTRAWKVVLSLSSDRPRWQFGRFHVERETEYGSSAAIFSTGSCCGWPCARICHDRWAPFLSTCHTRNHGDEVVHRTNTYLNNRIKQDHRGIKQRYYPTRGFGNFAPATRFCRAFDALRQYFRPRHMEKETLPLMQQRQLFRERLFVLQQLMGAAS